MNIWIGFAALFFILAIAGCGKNDVSGTYIAHDDSGAVLLQLTESKDQKIMGNIVLIELSSNGGMKRTEISITGGAVDSNGRTLVLTIKPNALFSMAQNVSGEVSNGGIDLAMPGSNIRLFPSSPQDFNTAVNRLAEAGKKRQQSLKQAEQMADNVKRIERLTSALSAYNTRIENSTKGPEYLRKQEEQLVTAAQKNLAIMKDLLLKNQDYPAGQVRFRIGQLTFEMGQIRFEVDQILEQGKRNLEELDNGIANSPCHTNAKLQGCDYQSLEKVRYTATREKVKKNLLQLSSDIEKNGLAIEAINKQAGN